MGRSGGGGGFSGGGHGGGSHHSSSFHSSSSRSSSSSYRSSSRPSSSRPGGYRPSGGYGYSSGYNSGYRRGYRRGYGSGYGYNTRPGYNAAPRPAGGSPAGCLSFIIIMFIVMIFMIGAAAFGGGTMTDNNLAEYSENQYKDIFSGREDCMLMVITDEDNGQVVSGVKTYGIMDEYRDVLIANYKSNYQDDLGIQIRDMFYDTIADMEQNGGVKPIKSDSSFTSNCFKDNLNWVDTKANLIDGAEAFYNETGIQPYILFVKEKTVVKATNKSTGVLKVLIIAVAVIIVISILFTWWKKRVAQKNKEQEDLEHILNTPLETFGTTEMQDLEAKYENAPGYTPPANNPPSQPSTPQAPAQPEAPANNSADSGSYWQNEGGSQNTYGGQDASFWANAANTDDPNNNQ